MNQSEATHIARLLEQFHDLFGFAAAAFLPKNANVSIGALMRQLNTQNPYGGTAFGFAALAIIYAFDAVAKELNHPAALDALADPTLLNTTLNHQYTNEPSNRACFRHLRNCFAHGRFSVAVQGSTTTVTLQDFQPKGGAQTFDAVCDAVIVVNMAEKILIEAHKQAFAVASPPPPATPPATP